MIFLGVLLFLFVILLVNLWNGVFQFGYIELNSMLIILGGILATLVSTRSFSLFFKGIRVILRRDYHITNDEKRACSALFSLLSKISVVSGVIGFIIGTLMLLKSLDDIYKLGPSIALSLLTILYGLIIGYFVFMPAKFSIENRISEK